MKNIELEESEVFTPCYDENGLIPCITQCAHTGEILMLAYMNEESIAKTLETGEVHYYSRSRQELWHKGATSGDIQRVISLRTDCDQDALLVRVEVLGKNNACCHTGRKTCFYREINLSDRDDVLLKHLG